MFIEWIVWFVQFTAYNLAWVLSSAFTWTDVLFFFLIIWMRKLGYIQFELVFINKRVQTWILDFITRGEWSKDQAVLLEQ